MQTGQIFFSYSRVDGKFALKLGEDLRRAGVDIWIDQIDIRPSEPWDEEIEKALHESGCLLVILSQTSVASDNVLNEINYALENKKQVLPIVIESNLKKPFNISRLQHIDFTGSYETGLNLLLKALNLRAAVPDKNNGSRRRIIQTSLTVAIVIIVAVLIKLLLFKPGIDNAYTLRNDSDSSVKTHSSTENISSIINGKWSTQELVNPFDEHDKYILEFELEFLGSSLVGSITMKSTVEWKGYILRKDFLDGKIKDNIISFHTVEQSISGSETTTYKNFYHGIVSNNKIEFTLRSDRPAGFPGQKFAAQRTSP